VDNYIDTSVVVALILPDAHTFAAEAWLGEAQDGLLVSDFAALEFAAVVSRQLRMGRMDVAPADAALTLFDDWTARMTRRAATTAVDVTEAEHIVRDFALKLAGPDALHLAMASRHNAQLITLDARLAEAARRRNVPIFIPS